MSDAEKVSDIKKFSLRLKNTILDMAYEAGASSSHFGGALSILEIISILFNYEMKLKKVKEKDWEIRDRGLIRDRLLLYKDKILVGAMYYSQGREKNKRTCIP